MKDESLKIKSNNELLTFINMCESKYGELITIEVINKKNFREGFFSKTDLNENTEIDYNSLGEIRFTFKRNDNEILSIIYDHKKKSFFVNTYNLKRQVEEKVEPKDKLDVKNYIDDPNCYYYSFANGEIVKMEPETHRYYIYDVNNGWIQSFEPVTWMHDNNVSFEEVHVPGKGRN